MLPLFWLCLFLSDVMQMSIDDFSEDCQASACKLSSLPGLARWIKPNSCPGRLRQSKLCRVSTGQLLGTGLRVALPTWQVQSLPSPFKRQGMQRLDWAFIFGLFEVPRSCWLSHAMLLQRWLQVPGVLGPHSHTPCAHLAIFHANCEFNAVCSQKFGRPRPLRVRADLAWSTLEHGNAYFVGCTLCAASQLTNEGRAADAAGAAHVPQQAHVSRILHGGFQKAFF